MSKQNGSLQESLIVEYPSVKHVRGTSQAQIDEEENEHSLSITPPNGKLSPPPLNLRMDISRYSMLKVMLSIGFSSLGGPMHQVEQMRLKFVEELAWIGEDVFQDILQICCSIPGSIAAQVAITLGTLMTKSCTGGVFSFIGFSLPSAILMGFIGCAFRILELISIDIPCFAQLALHGFASSCVAVVAQTAWKFSLQMQVRTNNFWMILVSFLLYIIYESPVFMITLMIIGGFAMQIIEEQDYSRFSAAAHKSFTESAYYQPYNDTTPHHNNNPNTEANNEKEEQANASPSKDEATLVKALILSDSELQLSELIAKQQGGMLGKRSIYAYLLILSILLFMRISSSKVEVDIAISFFYVGSLLTGGGHVGVPLLLAEFSGMMTKDIFFNGFSLNTMLPGPIVNLAVYVGGIVDGFHGTFIGFIFIYLPTFLFIWTALPYWHKTKNDPVIMNFVRGAGLVSIGFVFATAYKLWQNAGQDDIVTSTFLVMIAFILLSIYDMPTPYVLLLGGLLTVIRYLALHDYRGVEEPDTC